MSLAIGLGHFKDGKLTKLKLSTSLQRRPLFQLKSNVFKRLNLGMVDEQSDRLCATIDVEVG